MGRHVSAADSQLLKKTGTIISGCKVSENQVRRGAGSRCKKNCIAKKNKYP